MKLTKAARILLLGAPGAGKGTQSSRLIKQFPQIQSLSSGDCLRAEVAQGTPVGAKAAELIDKGGLVPDTTMVELITNQLRQREWLNTSSSWLLDGFPRTRAQAEKLDDFLHDNNADLNLVVELDVDTSVILERIEARWVHLASGRIYNLDYNPPKVAYKDDVTGEALSKRDDDTKEVFQKRLDKYKELVEPLKQYYEEAGILARVSGNTSDIIFPKLRDLVQKKFG